MYTYCPPTHTHTHARTHARTHTHTHTHTYIALIGKHDLYATNDCIRKNSEI